jgi:hypothetical protein
MALPIEAIADYCAQQPIWRLAVFGSALRNALGPESDIDLLVEYEPEARVNYFDMAQQEQALSLIIGRRVDLREAGELSRYFRERVLAAAQTICER